MTSPFGQPGTGGSVRFAGSIAVAGPPAAGTGPWEPLDVVIDPSGILWILTAQPSTWQQLGGPLVANDPVTYTASQSGIAVPAGAAVLRVVCVGGGGAGGGSAGSSPSQIGAAGGGGGAGQYVEAFVPVAAGNTYAVTVGAGGHRRDRRDDQPGRRRRQRHRAAPAPSSITTPARQW